MSAIIPLPSQALPLPEFYYDHTRSCCWSKNSQGGWIQKNEASIKRELRAAGYSSRQGQAELVTQLDQILIRIQNENDVAFAGSLAGYSKGVHEVGGQRILVTESPTLILPKEGPWPVISAILEGLLNDPIQDQRLFLYGWLKVAIEALRTNSRRSGQAMAITGPHNCGKSVLQNQIFTPLLGGRVAKPYQFMTGGTPFNADLFGAEHLTIEDEAASTDLRSRRHFGANLKNITVNDVQRHHAKNRGALSMTPFWRLSITVNDEPENLMILPVIDDSIEDKIILLKANKKDMPMPTNTDDERKRFQETIQSELPAFMAYLLAWEIPEELKSRRFGITHYHHPEILSAIDDLAPERRLLTLIDGEIFKEMQFSNWEGTSEELERKLTSNEAECAYEARRVLSFNTACGVYLARLAKKVPERISERRTKAGRQWTIKPN